jgi:hypothetical protein
VGPVHLRTLAASDSGCTQHFLRLILKKIEK